MYYVDSYFWVEKIKLKKSSRRIKAQNSQTQIQKETVNTVKDEERLVQEQVQFRPNRQLDGIDPQFSSENGVFNTCA